MNKKLALKIFIEIQKISGGYINNEDEYERITHMLIGDYGFDDEEANKLIGSYNLTLKNNLGIKEFTPKTDLSLIEIAKPLPYFVEYIETYKVTESIIAKIGSCYSDIEAKANYYASNFYDEDSQEIDREFLDRDLDRLFIDD